MRVFETHINTTKDPVSTGSTTMQVRLVPLRSLKPARRNARTHSKRQIGQLANSILALGWTYPILIDDQGNIIAGNGRFQAASQLGLSEVPVLTVTGLTAAQKRTVAIADNKIAANAGWDRSILAAEIGELSTLLPEINLDISITGFDPAELDALAVDFTDTERNPADEVPVRDEKPAVSKIDDVWFLGPHRIICGDACDDDVVRTLMDGKRASMVFADPPYNLRIGAIVGRGKIKHREFVSGSGEMSSQQFVHFMTRWMRLAAQHSENGAICYACIDWRHITEILTAGTSVFREVKNIIVWVKSNPGQGSFYRSAHEFICVFKHGDGPLQNNVELGKHGRNRSNVWTYPGANTFRAGRLDELTMHPTVKPVALVADAIRDCSRRGEVIFDPFLGSGTTVLAAERVGRKGFGIELDPRYVDVAVRRWQSFTKRDAISDSPMW
jgi:DNA modification methylase